MRPIRSVAALTLLFGAGLARRSPVQLEARFVPGVRETGVSRKSGH